MATLMTGAGDARRGKYVCPDCEDWGTDVTDGQLHPCPTCRPEDWKAWRFSQLPEPGNLVAVKSVSQQCRVVLPSAVGLEGANCIEVGQTCCTPVVLVQSVDDGAVWWADLPDVEIVPPQ